MGVMSKLLTLLFGSGRNVVAQTTEVFRENAEAGAQRRTAERGAALDQFGNEFGAGQTGWFDRMMDGVNRLPRPALALGTLGLFIAAMVDPVWFAARMQGIALVPEPLWWLLGVIVSFYFGARHQFKGQTYRTTIAQAVASAPRIARSIEALEGGGPTSSDEQTTATSKPATKEANPALREWREQER